MAERVSKEEGSKERNRKKGRREGRKEEMKRRGKGEYEAEGISDLRLNSSNCTLCDSDRQKMFHFCNQF